MILYIVALAMIISILFIIYSASKNPHPFLRAMGSSISGILGLTFVLSIYNYTNIAIPINLFTLSVSSLLGIPGVGLLMLLNNIIFNF